MVTGSNCKADEVDGNCGGVCGNAKLGGGGVLDGSSDSGGRGRCDGGGGGVTEASVNHQCGVGDGSVVGSCHSFIEESSGAKNSTGIVFNGQLGSVSRDGGACRA
jgi:hypothetical protein